MDKTATHVIASERSERSNLRDCFVLLAVLGVLAMTGGIFLSGCGDMQTPTAKEALRQPFGTGGPFDRGTTKNEVLAEWGNPDHVISHGVDELGNTREEWIYAGRIPNLPIDVEYVSRTKHLFFEGDHLVRWETEEPEQR